MSWNNYLPSISHLMKWSYTGCGRCVQRVCPRCLSFRQVSCEVSFRSQRPLNTQRRKLPNELVVHIVNISFIVHEILGKKIMNGNQHLIMAQSLAAEKMYLSSEEMTRQVTGSLCPRNTLISDASGAWSWGDDRGAVGVRNGKGRFIWNLEGKQDG